ncbi:helix-turn-helix transcriptional regulator [Staphylococcus saprophyticus]|uniref:helix-turn-helix domain-containing protein n=1 Tax=Staphylococcus saprophyticus TaxID=29385 RepID=UPI000853B34E|nr:helix-turn-helix transcriptional regulator [Staphylococcus saprophyticus]MDW4129897.1 helix-turn-helix transcriptional regulator [Staphylococcus saprophyticus]MDW4288172.1 helix-turn-helix transcriptional regulator [Staphylococcus saprophyticus]MDW4446049.1 helix-turn-helix transcriptional regulator [Staphylococcus saprophyticus]OEK40800.1 Cro/Cl family transcriptional regulator [Staphylococcus saprophyticus]
MRNNDEIISLISKLMDKQNLSTSELARRTDMAKSTVSRYLNKSREFPLNRADDFAKVLKVTPEYLLGLEEKKQTNSFETIAAHLNGELTEEEWQEVIEYAEYIKSKRKK